MALKEKDKQAWIDKNMKLMGWTQEEAESVWEADRAIDKGERVDFDLSPEQEKEAKKYMNAGTRKVPTNYKFDQRKRKENPTKAGIIAELATFLVENSENACENVEITNKERMIAFKVGENCYELTLTQKRKPKS